MRYRTLLFGSLLVLCAGNAAAQQRRTVTGTVTDEATGRAISGAQIVIKGTNTGTLGKADGTFVLAVPTGINTLVVNFIGYKRVEVRLTATQNTVQVPMKVDVLKLDEIVVTGQATGMQRRNLANAVAKVSSEELVKAPTATVEQALQGKLTGAQISQNSGAPGGGVQVRLRGVTSINGASTPLYVVDGAIVSDAAIPPGTNFLTQANPGVSLTTTQENQVNRIADLNPNDIESIEVLKGAAASAIYGSKASNGVIIITTKRGRIGAPQISLSQRFGYSAASRLVGSRKFLTLADAVAAFGDMAKEDFVPGVVFDNEGALAGNKPLSYETSASVSGGTENTRYFASGLVKRDGGIVTNTFYDKQALRLNLDQGIGNKFNFSVNSEVIHSQSDRGLVNNENNGSSYWSAFSTTPSFFDLRQRPDGTWPNNKYGFSNPLQTAALFKNNENVWRFIGTGKMTYEAISSTHHNLRILANGGADFFDQKNSIFSPPELQFEPLDGFLGTSASSYSNNLSVNLNGNAVYKYTGTGGLAATTSVGLQYETRDLATDRVLAANLVGGLAIVSSATSLIVEANHQRVADYGMFAQEEVLMLGEKLLLTAGLRADASSNNGDPNQLFYYPKAAASYRLPVNGGLHLEELKLRAAFGQSGNQPLYGQKFTELQSLNIGGLPASRVQTVTGATDIKPERQREIEGGLDAVMFGSRATVELTAYEKRITDLLLKRTLVPTSGFDKQIFNGGVIRTRGVEAGITVLPIQSKTSQMATRYTFFASRCKVLDLPVPTFRSGGVSLGAIQIEKGKSCSQLMGYDSLPDGSRVIKQVGDAAPDYKMSLSNDLTYKRARFYFLLDYQKGGRLANFTQWLYDFPANSVDYDVMVGTQQLGLKRLTDWRKQTTVYLQETTYLKLRDVTVSFDLPPSMFQKFWAGARSVRLGVSGRNLLSWSTYQGLDPETSQVPGSLASARPWDLWGYPPARTFWMNVDLGF